MGLRGFSWDSVGFRELFIEEKTKYKIHDRGIPWVSWDSVGFPGIPWVFVGFRGFFTRVKKPIFPRVSNPCLWGFVGSRGSPWGLVGFLGILWVS